jgi:pyridoxamine 5'-phosphate oxidase
VTAIDPLIHLQEWYASARAAGVPEPEAAALATATPDGRPSVRIVLLRGIEPDGVSFFTNYESRKGRELADNPRAALAIHWQAQQRQVRLEGTVERVPAEASDAYFASRPRGSRIGAWASRQGSVLPDRQALEERFDTLEAEWRGQDIARPPYWGGYMLRPDAIEFWEGRPSRLHDRIHYLREDDGWREERLSP